MTAGLRVLAQIGDPRDDTRRGLISAAQAEEIAGLYGPAASDRVITERALGLEARLRALETLGSAPARLPPGPLRVVALDRAAEMAGTEVLGAYVIAAFTHLLRRQPRGPAWQHTLLVAGGEKLRGELLDRLADACEASGTGLVLAYRSLPAHVRDRLGRGNAAVAFMRLGNAGDAKAASEQIGTVHRFVVSQLTDTVGDSVSGTASYSYTSTVGTADSVAVSASASHASGQGRGQGHSWSGAGAFAPRTASGHREGNWSDGISASRSWTGGRNASSAWGLQTARAVAATASAARTRQRSREFLVEQHELQQLPPSGMIVSYASAAGRRVVFADANPGILTLPTATLAGLDEARPAIRPAPTRPARTRPVCRRGPPSATQTTRREPDGSRRVTGERGGLCPSGAARVRRPRGRAGRQPGRGPRGRGRQRRAGGQAPRCGRPRAGGPGTPGAPHTGTRQPPGTQQPPGRPHRSRRSGGRGRGA